MMRIRFLAIYLCVTAALAVSAYEKDVWISNHEADIRLAGTLAIPQVDSEVPKTFVVLVSGSGAQNRDEEIMGHRPFKVISDSLSSAGFGVLRLDDRGVGASEGIFETATQKDFESDAVAAVSFLRDNYPGAKIGILGHSQGGGVAIMAAAESRVDFIVTLAAPAWRGDSLIMSQGRALATATSGSWSNQQLERRLLDITSSDMPGYIAEALLYATVVEQIGDAANLPHVREQIMNQVKPLLSPMYRNMLKYDPADDIRSVKVPWLALGGDKDLQVLSDNLYTIKTLCPGAITILLPGHNHLFQSEAITGLPSEYPLGGQSPSHLTLVHILNFLHNLYGDN